MQIALEENKKATILLCFRDLQNTQIHSNKAKKCMATRTVCILQQI